MNCFLYDECNHKDCNSDFCLRKYKLDYIYNVAGLSEKNRTHIALYPDSNGTDLEVFKKLAAIGSDIENFVNTGSSLYIYSAQAGNGKTSWAFRLMQNYFNKIWARTDLTCRGMFVDVTTFLLRLKSNISMKDETLEEFKRNILKADLVIWDDVGTKIGTEFELTNLFSLINSRINAGKANIYTSNRAPGDLQDLLGERLASRIGELSTVIELRGGDKRGLVSGGNN